MILRLTLSANDKMSGVIRGVTTSSDKEFAKMQKKIEGVSDSLDKVGKGALVAGGVIAAPLVMGVKSAADFGSELSNIKAITGETNENIGKLRKLALKMGADTKFSALEAAQGITELQKAGVTTAQILNGGLAGALDLAAAGDLELADAAEIASTALNAFRDDNLSVAAASNILAGAANASATSVGELKYSLSMVAAVASGFKMSFKDTNIALALFAQNGLKGSDAGTSLKSMLMNLQPRTDEQVNTFVRLGLAQGKLVKVTKAGKEQYKLMSNAFFDSKGNIKSTTEISGLLHDKLKGLTNQQRLYALETMFGADAIRAANILFKEGAKGADKMWQSMSKVTAAQVAAVKMDNLKGALEELGGSIETSSINLGEKLVPSIKKLAEGVTLVTNLFGALPEPIQTVIALGGAFTAISLIGIGGVSLALSGLLKGFNDFAPIYRDMIGFMSKNNLRFFSFDLIGLDKQLRGALKNSLLNFSAGFSTLGAGISLAKDKLYLFACELVRTTPDKFIAGLNTTKLSFKEFLPSIGKVIKSIWSFNAALLSSPITWIGLAIGGAALLVIKYWNPIKGLFRGIFKGIAEGTRPLHPAFKRISTAVKPVVDWFKKLVTPINSAGKASEAFGLKVGKAIGEAITWVAKLTNKVLTLGGLWKNAPWLGKSQNAQLKGATPPKVNGSHANGLGRVPFDGYIAELHKDESVLTAGQSRSLRQGSIATSPIYLTYAPVINSTIKDASELKKVLEEHERKFLAKLETMQRRKEARAYA